MGKFDKAAAPDTVSWPHPQRDPDLPDRAVSCSRPSGLALMVVVPARYTPRL